MTIASASESGSDLRPFDADQKHRVVLRLYVAGTTERSMLAIKNIRRVCEQHLVGRYDLEVIDIYQHPEVAAQAQIIAAPTLIRLSPMPVRRAIGDLSNEARLLTTLDLSVSDLHGQ